VSAGRCAHRSYGGSGSAFRGRPCSRDAKLGSDYCSLHNPDAVKARQAARSAKWDAQWAHKQAVRDAGQKLLMDLGISGFADSDGTIRISQSDARSILERLR
jgi:hypothetical protein